MKNALWVMVVLSMAATTLPAYAQAPAQPTAPAAAPTYAVTFLETGAPSAPRAAAALRRFAVASRKETGNATFLVLRERGRPGRFIVVEGWRDPAALEAHDKAAKAEEERLGPLLVGPPDRRPLVALDVAPQGGSGEAAVYVVTHVDVIPPKKDETVALVKQLAADSRKDTGVQGFDVLQQPNRPNHMFLVEAWRDRTAHDAHVMADHTRTYRAKLLPFQGALYDERVAEPVR